MKNIFILAFLFVAAVSGCAQSTDEDKGQWLKDNQKTVDTSARKTVNGFGANLLVVNNPDEFIKEWLKPETPNLDTAENVNFNDKIGILVLFAGCRTNSNGICNTEVDYTVYRPDGKVIFEQKGLELWKNNAPPKPNIQLGKAIIKLEMLKSNLIGEYKVKAKVYDKNADVSFDLETQFTLKSK